MRWNDDKARRRWPLWAAGIGGLGVLAYLVAPRGYCGSAKDRYGIEVPVCPDGKVRQKLHIRGSGLRRGGKGMVVLRATALYVVGASDDVKQATIPEIEQAKLSLVDAQGKERSLQPDRGPLSPRKGWTRGEGYARREVALPKDIHDGDYKLRARVETEVGKGQVDLPLPLYAPARIHVLTDRPLYEPGNRVKFRALALRARDLTPLDHRPGRWLVKDPAGNVLLEEKVPAGAWGVASGDFPLDDKAPTGTWKITWRSGNDHGTAEIRVEPFTLPRFRVTASSGKAFYGAGDKPTVSGAVVYSSGAPVQGARLQIRWRVSGSWPPPAGWTAGGLPRSAVTDSAGRFSIGLPQVPADLQGKATLRASLSAVDPAGDRVAGSVSVLLSQDPISVSAITPLADGLVAGFNNRLYLRVTTPDGRPLPGAKVEVRKAWDAGGDPIAATLDADSVARIQIDPGAPVNVVIPAKPVRKSSAPRRVVVRKHARDLIGAREASLADQLEMDRWLALVKPCAKWVQDAAERAQLGLQVSASGKIVSTTASSPLQRCIAERIERRRLPKGRERLYRLALLFSEPALPRISTEIATASGGTEPDGLEQLFDRAALDARDCLPRTLSGELSHVLLWQLKEGQKSPRVSWVVAKSEGLGAAQAVAHRDARKCILSRVTKRRLAESADRPAFGVVRYTLSQPDSDADQPKPRPTIMKGYELSVAATHGDQALGQTKLRLKPGRIPALTVRATPVVARPGEKITVRMLRGPGFSGSLPRVITVEHVGNTKRLKLEEGAKSVAYTLPDDAEGWYAFAARGQRALVFVRRGEDLAVAVRPDKKRYAPGARARLQILTRVGKRPVRAGVGLVGVDATLGQLVELPGPDALRSVRPKIEMKEKPFGVLDGQALTLGRVRGKYAAEATVLRVASVPSPPEIDVVINGSASTELHAVAQLTDRFYIVLAELYRAVRRWERETPKKKRMTPSQMAGLWKKALDACATKNKPIEDAFGRTLRLHRLPADLLALTAPRQVVSEGTRLPEDVEPWARWVARNKP